MVGSVVVDVDVGVKRVDVMAADGPERHWRLGPADPNLWM